MQSHTKILKGSSLELYDSKDRLRIWMDAGNDNCPDWATITLFSANNTNRIELAAHSDGCLNISILDRDSTAQVKMTMNPERKGGFLVNGPTGKQGVVLGGRFDSDVHQLLLFSEEGLIWSSPQQKAEQDAAANP